MEIRFSFRRIAMRIQNRADSRDLDGNFLFPSNRDPLYAK
jgi:hypothetical protein